MRMHSGRSARAVLLLLVALAAWHGAARAEQSARGVAANRGGARPVRALARLLGARLHGNDSSYTAKDVGFDVCIVQGNCNGHGTCTNGACVCYAGYTGASCQGSTTGGSCANVYCGSHGTCDPTLGRCLCTEFWGGAKCDQELSAVDPCVNLACVHGACSAGKCNCFGGYTGTLCTVAPGGAATPTPSTNTPNPSNPSTPPHSTTDPSTSTPTTNTPANNSPAPGGSSDSSNSNSNSNGNSNAAPQTAPADDTVLGMSKGTATVAIPVVLLAAAGGLYVFCRRKQNGARKSSASTTATELQ